MKTRLAVILIAAMALTAGACGGVGVLGGGGGGSDKKKLVNATIYLIPRADGSGKTCSIVTVPQVLEIDGRPGSSSRAKEEVLWSIVDACRGTVASNVEIKFAAADPTENCSADTASTGKSAKRKIRCQIAAAANGTYKYAVALGDIADAEDPELEIVY